MLIFNLNQTFVLLLKHIKINWFMRSYWVVLLCFISVLSTCQNSFLTPQLMHEDLNYLNKYLRKWHPTYYSYTPKEAMNKLYSDLKDTCSVALSEREFMLNVRKAVVKVGCGHMGIYLNRAPKDLKLIPLKVWILGNRMFVKAFNSRDSTLKVGDEILSINGENISDFIQKAKEILVSDGFNESYKITQLESSLGIILYFLYGELPDYSLKVKNTEGGISEISIKSVINKEIPISPKIIRDSSKLVIKGKAVGLYKTDFDASTLVLDVDNFNGKKQGRTFRKVFKYLKANQIQNLVIDIRNNGGGSIFKGNKLLSYLLNQPIIPFVISRKPNLTAFNPRLKGKFFEKITPVLFMTNPLQFPSKDGWNHLFPFFKKSRHHFDGKIYVLTNSGSFSMASYVASYLKHKRNATVVGDETGGSEYASRSSAGGQIHLPNSKIKVLLNLYQTKHYVGIEDSGHGVMPDYPTNYTIEDMLKNVDLDLKMVENLVKNKQ